MPRLPYSNPSFRRDQDIEENFTQSKWTMFIMSQMAFISAICNLLEQHNENLAVQ